MLLIGKMFSKMYEFFLFVVVVVIKTGYHVYGRNVSGWNLLWKANLSKTYEARLTKLLLPPQKNYSINIHTQIQKNRSINICNFSDRREQKSIQAKSVNVHH